MPAPIPVPRVRQTTTGSPQQALREGGGPGVLNEASGPPEMPAEAFLHAHISPAQVGRVQDSPARRINGAGYPQSHEADAVHRDARAVHHLRRFNADRLESSVTVVLEAADVDLGLGQNGPIRIQDPDVRLARPDVDADAGRDPALTHHVRPPLFTSLRYVPGPRSPRFRELVAYRSNTGDRLEQRKLSSPSCSYSTFPLLRLVKTFTGS
jgi:hypothetical protein